MNQYLYQKEPEKAVRLCKRLEKIGLESNSKMWWVTAQGVFVLLDLDSKRKCPVNTMTAFTYLDIIGNRENAIKLFGEEPTCLICGWKNQEPETMHYYFNSTPSEKAGYYWEYCCYQLLDTLLSGGNFESELEKWMGEHEN